MKFGREFYFILKVREAKQLKEEQLIIRKL